MIITAQWLKEIGACSWREFGEAYPNGSPRAYEAALKAAICDADKWDWGWVARRLPATAYKAYGEAMATADKAYGEATATAYKAYREAMATADKAYREAEATAFVNAAFGKYAK